MIDKGLMGVKTGKGFYDWSNPEFMQPDFLNPKKK
jgi:3-hydroxyacyl-CoA dehydrogenase